MKKIDFASRKKDWRFWVLLVLGAIGLVLTGVGVIGTMVEMGRVFGYISLFSFVTYHWSFWVAFAGIVLMAVVYVWRKLSKKGGK